MPKKKKLLYDIERLIALQRLDGAVRGQALEDMWQYVQMETDQNLNLKPHEYDHAHRLLKFFGQHRF